MINLDPPALFFTRILWEAQLGLEIEMTLFASFPDSYLAGTQKLLHPWSLTPIFISLPVPHVQMEQQHVVTPL